MYPAGRGRGGGGHRRRPDPRRVRGVSRAARPALGGPRGDGRNGPGQDEEPATGRSGSPKRSSSPRSPVMHGEDDQIVPVKDSAKKSARLIKGAKEINYPGAPHGLTATHQDRVNADLLAFLRGMVLSS